MSLDTLITLLLSVVLAVITIVVTIITVIKHNKEGKAKLKKLLWIMVVIVVVTVLLICLYYFTNTHNSKKENEENFISLVTQGEFAEINKQYIKAAGLFEKAQEYAFDADSEAYALQSQGTCYMLIGVSISDEQYLIRALSIFKTVLETEKYENTLGYLTAMIDICTVYDFLNYDYTDEAWAGIIKKLENTISFEDLQNKSIDALAFIISAGWSISDYYCGIRESSALALLFGQEDGGKALYYLKATIEAEKYYNEQVGGYAYNEDHFNLIYKMTNYLMIDAVFNIDEAISKNKILSVLEETREICQEAISELNIQNEYQLINYIRLKRNVGKSYYFSSLVTNQQTDLQQAHEQLMSLFDLKGEEITYELLVSASYALLTQLCTDEEIGHILDKCEMYIERLRSETTVPALIGAEYEVLTICSTILSLDTAEKTRANEMGSQYCIEIRRQYNDLLTDQQKQELDDFEQRFFK